MVFTIRALFRSAIVLKKGFAEMDLITLTIMNRAESPTALKGPKLQPISFNTRTIAANITKDVTDAFELFRRCDFH
ncbi:hypothetical protein [Pseudomonas sp. ef1]